MSMNEAVLAAVAPRATVESEKPDALSAGIGHALDALLAQQHADGHWVYELEADATIPSEYVLMVHYLGETPDTALEARIARYLRRIQNADGGWPLFHEGRSDISASVKAYFALKMTGDDPEAPHMRRAREAVRAMGGAEASNVFTRTLLALYGVMPSAHVGLAGVEPALRLSTKIMALHDVPPGMTVSYGGLWRAGRPSRIATLPVGYADGYPRHVRDASVLLRGARAPIVGAVCMDMLMVDVTDVTGAGVGDDVTLIGGDGGQSITVDDLARWAGTISYEILCGISKRVPRVYNLASQRPARPPQTPQGP